MNYLDKAVKKKRGSLWGAYDIVIYLTYYLSQKFLKINWNNNKKF